MVFLYFICDVIFDKLSELPQVCCLIPHYIEIQDSTRLIMKIGRDGGYLFQNTRMLGESCKTVGPL